MNQNRALISLAIILVLAAYMRCKCDKISARKIYGRALIPKDYESNSKDGEKVREILERWASEYPQMSTRIIERIMLMKLIGPEELKGIERSICYLVVFIRGRADKANLIPTFKLVWATIKNEQGSIYEVWKRYLSRYAAGMFRSVASRIYKRTNWLPEGRVLENLDTVFGKAFKLSRASERFSRDLLERLRKFDFTQVDYNAFEMVKEIERVVRVDVTSYQFVWFKRFMLDQCEEFEKNEHLTRLFELIDSALYFRREFYFDSRLGRLVKYHHLCLSLSIPESEKLIEKNFERLYKQGRARL